MKRIICALLAVAHLAACTTLSTVPYGEGAATTGQSRSLAIGDDLRITFREGGEKRIKVTSLDAGQICAADGCIAMAEIAKVERTEVSGGKIVLAALAVLVLAALLSSMHPLGGGLGVAALR